MNYELEPQNHIDIENDFRTQLIARGCISMAFAQTGALEHFSKSLESGTDSLEHVLVGDGKDGGMHHLPTMLHMETEDSTARTDIEIIQNPDVSQRVEKPFMLKKNKALRQQMIQENGVAVVAHTTSRGVPKTKLNPKGERVPRPTTMFPNEWSTEQVIDAMIQTANTPPANGANEVRQSYTHQSVVDGVQVRVITHADTGKIITGYPLV